MGHGAGEAEKKAKELVEKMVRWKSSKNTTGLQCENYYFKSIDTSLKWQCQKRNILSNPNS